MAGVRERRLDAVVDESLSGFSHPLWRQSSPLSYVPLGGYDAASDSSAVAEATTATVVTLSHIVGWTAPLPWWEWAGIFVGCAILWPWAVIMWLAEKMGLVTR